MRTACMRMRVCMRTSVDLGMPVHVCMRVLMRMWSARGESLMCASTPGPNKAKPRMWVSIGTTRN